MDPRPTRTRPLVRAVLILTLITLLALSPQVEASPPPNNIVGINLGRFKQSQYIWAASDLVNANGGEWGYITVTWTIEDRETAAADYNLQQFLDRCFEYQVQPIIRVATKFDEKRGIWHTPQWDEPLKWRAFFERASWPTRRVWVIAGNEPNLGREWDGEVDAATYARYLERFLDVFQDSERFKVINAPLDISNGTELPRMQDALQFIEVMRAEVPNIFDRLPAWASNPYRVPSGGNRPRFTHRAYEVELETIGRDMPVLITEAHIMQTEDPEQIAAFFQTAFDDWMNDPRVVAATPLFWHPDKNEFWMYSLGKHGGIQSTSLTYHRLKAMRRVRGTPDYVPSMANRPWVPKPAVDAEENERLEGAAVADPPARHQPSPGPAQP